MTEQFDPMLLTDDEIRMLPEWPSEMDEYKGPRSFVIGLQSMALNVARAVARAQLAKAVNATAAASKPRRKMKKIGTLYIHDEVNECEQCGCVPVEPEAR